MIQFLRKIGRSIVVERGEDKKKEDLVNVHDQKFRAANFHTSAMNWKFWGNLSSALPLFRHFKGIKDYMDSHPFPIHLVTVAFSLLKEILAEIFSGEYVGTAHKSLRRHTI